MIKYPTRNLDIVHECDDDNGNPCCWSMAGEYDPNAKRSHFIWICKYGEKEYIVENSEGHNLAGGKVFKTLWGAKREAEGIIWRQDETGCYSD